MACTTYALGIVLLALSNVNMCNCRNILPLTRSSDSDRPETRIFVIRSSAAGSEGIILPELASDVARRERGMNRTSYLFNKINALTTAVADNRSELSRMRRELKQKRISFFGLTGSVHEQGLLLYNQYIAFKDMEEGTKDFNNVIDQQLNPWPIKDDKVTIPYFFSEAKPPFDKAEKWMSMAFEQINTKTCVTIEQARGVVGANCETRVPQVTNSLCIESGDGCYSLLGAGHNPQRLVINETCLSASMTLRLITLAVGLGYQMAHTNYMQADAGLRAEHGYCHSRLPEISDRFQVKSASAVGFAIDAGSSDYEAIHVTARPEDQALLHNRKNTFFELRRVDVAQINAFNKCEEPIYGPKCRSQLRVCQKRTNEYPNVIGLTKDCKCRCRDGWEGNTCNTASKKEKVPKGFYGCHKNLLLRRGQENGVSYFLLSDIELDIISEPPYLCTINIQSKWRDLGYYCRGYAPIIRVDVSALYRELRSQGVTPFSMRDACERFRLYFQSGVDKYQRRVLCADAVLQGGGKLMLHARGPNTTLFFVMNPENTTEKEALLKIQVGIQNRLYVACDTVLYYRNPLSFNVHRSEFQFHAKYLIEFLIGIVVFMVISYVAYDYWMTRRRVAQMRRRRQAKQAAKEAEEEEDSSSDSSEASSDSAKSTHKVEKSSSKVVASDPKAVVSEASTKGSSTSVKDLSPELSPTPSESEKSSGGNGKLERRSTLKEIADSQPKKKKKKEEKKKSGLPPILAQKAKVKQTDDLDGGASASPDVEEPTSFLSQISTKSSSSPPPSSPPKKMMKRLSSRKGKKPEKKKKADSDDSTSSDETLKEALKRYISEKRHPPSDSEDDESVPA